MLIAAFLVLGSAALLGSVLAVHHFRSASPAWPLGGLHGLFGLAGLGCLVATLGGPPRGLRTGTAAFGVIAAGLIAVAVLVGGAMLLQRLRKRRLHGVLIGIHATIAVSGFVVLAAYIFVG